MQRVTPDQIFAAFALTGLRKTHGNWGEPQDGSACGLMAVAHMEEDFLDSPEFDARDPIDAQENYLCRVIGITEEYRDGFISAWDNYPTIAEIWARRATIQSQTSGKIETYRSRITNVEGDRIFLEEDWKQGARDALEALDLLEEDSPKVPKCMSRSVIQDTTKPTPLLVS